MQCKHHTSCYLLTENGHVQPFLIGICIFLLLLSQYNLHPKNMALYHIIHVVDSHFLVLFPPELSDAHNLNNTSEDPVYALRIMLT